MSLYTQNINGEIKFHNDRGGKDNLKELETFLAKKGWQLTICSTFMPGSDYGKWYEMFDLSGMSNKQAMNEILYYHNHKAFRDFSYIFICHSPHKVKEEIERHKQYAYFDYHVVGGNGSEFLEYLKQLLP